MTHPQPPANRANYSCTLHGQVILALARTMLDTVVRCHQAVLQDDCEKSTVIRNVVRHILTADPLLAAALKSDDEPEGSVKAVLAHAVRTHQQPLAQRSLAALQVPSTAAAATPIAAPAQDREDAVAKWFFELSQLLHAAHPRAAEILRARLLGLDSRKIAEKLELPPGLVRHLFSTMTTWGIFAGAAGGAET